MSALAATNGETVKEMLKRASAAKKTSDWNSRQGREYREFACRNYVYAAELALKAVYVKHEQPFERTHNIWELYRNRSDPSRPGEGLTGAALQSFFAWYPAPYFIDRQVIEQDLRECQDVAGGIVRWAEGIIHGR